MRLRRSLKCMAFFAFMFVLLVIPAKTAQAANPSQVTLEADKTYKSYDITGDKKKDTIKIKTTKDQYDTITKVSVVINGKSRAVYNTWCYGVDAKICTLKNGKPFLYLFLYADNDDGDVCGVFQYKSGKLKQVIDCNTFFSKKGDYCYHINGGVTEVKGNSLTVRYSIMSYTVGSFTCYYQYDYKNGTLKCSGAQTSKVQIYPSTTLTAQKNIKVYTKPDGKKVSYTLKPGKRIKVTGAYVKSGVFSLKIKNFSTGKTGWIKCLKKSPSDWKAPFKETIYAG